MTSRAKHMERSHRSYHNPKPFGEFERKAKVRTVQKERRKSILESLKTFFHRTTNK